MSDRREAKDPHAAEGAIIGPPMCDARAGRMLWDEGLARERLLVHALRRFVLAPAVRALVRTISFRARRRRAA